MEDDIAVEFFLDLLVNDYRCVTELDTTFKDGIRSIFMEGVNGNSVQMQFERDRVPTSIAARYMLSLGLEEGVRLIFPQEIKKKE